MKLIMHVSDYFLKLYHLVYYCLLCSVQPCYWVGFKISLSREGAIFRDEIENYFLAPTWRDEIEIII